MKLIQFFNGEFNAVGDKKEITYDVTNASKNYDADIEISCTQSTSYLTITNDFDVESNLPARSTRSGVLTITLSKSYTGTDLTQEISCEIIASAVERTSQGINNVVGPIGEYYIGREISFGDEIFNLISDNGDTITLLAQYNLGTDYRQSTTNNYVKFANTNGWEYTPGPKEIDIQNFDGPVKTYVNAYIEYLKTELGDDSVTGNLITLKDLERLGCIIPSDYDDGVGTWTCDNSPYISWLINGQAWWTRSANSSVFDDLVWWVKSDGALYYSTYSAILGVRPVITISKSTLEGIGQVSLITFTVEGIVYYAEEGMDWEQWIDSEYNIDGFYINEVGICSPSAEGHLFADWSQGAGDIIQDGYEYYLSDEYLGGGV